MDEDSSKRAGGASDPGFRTCSVDSGARWRSSTTSSETMRTPSTSAQRNGGVPCWNFAESPYGPTISRRVSHNRRIASALHHTTCARDSWEYEPWDGRKCGAAMLAKQHAFSRVHVEQYEFLQPSRTQGP